MKKKKPHGDKSFFLRFYQPGPTTVDTAVAEIRALGHTFTEKQEPMTLSVNFGAPPGIELVCYFATPQDLQRFQDDDRVREIYLKYAHPTVKDGELVLRKPGDAAFEV